MLFDELFRHYCMERLDFCTLIKHIFKTGSQNDILSKDFISVHKQTRGLKCRIKIYNKKRNSSGLKINALDLYIINLYLLSL